MRRILMIAGLAAAAAAPSMLPSAASARGYCEQRAHDRRVTGTLLGAVGGGLLGNAVSSGGGRTGGTLIGAGLGAVVGNNLARTSCDRPRAYYRRPAPVRYYGAVPADRYAAGPAACHYETRPFYDARGRLIYSPIQVCG
ncbi:glycine zipper 2TM domain-containing protein [Phenylobacterium sp.]|jgi:hypothetical protein|uniref:glycine zipper 2TM domain-containing protein n=1 Tax=Phenylobacterium sp. TaxID=1871053 RepID=UPI002E2FF1E9|nr:glycine zipper 2TM domain-containing protein [Phenylobacterium sp.]HEX4711967.1 glycine zipper 2TM domain-containing protein [Phenylobacterium sp.]